MPKEEKVISNQEFTEPFEGTSDVITNYEVFVAQEVYPIDRADYQTLSKGSPNSLLSSLGSDLLAAVLLVAFTMLIKVFIAAGNKSDIGIEAWEVYLTSFVLILSIIMLVASSRVPSERKSLLEKMRQHFETRPRTLSAKKKK